VYFAKLMKSRYVLRRDFIRSEAKYRARCHVLYDIL